VLKKTISKTTQKHVMYSIRHNWRDWLYEAGATQDEVDYLMGHAPKSVGQRYGSGRPSLKRLQALVKTVLMEIQIDSPFG